MKKHVDRAPFGAVLAALLALAFAPAMAVPASSAVNVVATTTDLAAIAREVGGGKVEATSLAKGRQDPHFVDAKPSFMSKMNQADLLVVVGLEMEIGYLPSLIDGARNSKIRPGSPGYVDASAGCDILDIPSGKLDRSMGDVHAFGNPHYWLDPLNGKRIAKNIAEGLARVDPSNGAFYRENAAKFGKRIDAAMKEWTRRLAPARGAQIVTYHKSMTNFAKRFGLEIVGQVEPKPGISPSPSHTLDTIKLIKSRNIKAILIEPYYERKAADLIASKTGAKVVVVPTMTGGADGVDDYFDLFDRITREVSAAFASSQGARR